MSFVLHGVEFTDAEYERFRKVVEDLESRGVVRGQRNTGVDWRQVMRGKKTRTVYRVLSSYYSDASVLYEGPFWNDALQKAIMCPTSHIVVHRGAGRDTITLGRDQIEQEWKSLGE